MIASRCSNKIVAFARKQQPLIRRSNWSSTFDKIFHVEALSDIEPINIYGGSDKSAIASFRTLSDNDYGGKSTCELVKTPTGLKFKGLVTFNEEIADSTKAKGGFCAIKGLCKHDGKSFIDLRDYEGIQITMRSSIKQIYTLNLTCVSMFEDDLYQLDIQVGTNWRTFHIPFSYFRLTAKGQDREYQRQNDSLHVEALGVLMKAPNVPFELEISEIAALAQLDDANLIKRSTTPY